MGKGKRSRKNVPQFSHREMLRQARLEADRWKMSAAAWQQQVDMLTKQYTRMVCAAGALIIIAVALLVTGCRVVHVENYGSGDVHAEQRAGKEIGAIAPTLDVAP